MPERIIAKGKEIKSFVDSYKSCVSCNITGGYCLKSKDSFISLNIPQNLQADKIFIVLKKLSGNGKCNVIFENFCKSYVISNSVKIELPYTNKININRGAGSIGDISLVSISYLYSTSIVQEEKIENKAIEKDNNYEEELVGSDILGIIKNTKLYTNERDVQDYTFYSVKKYAPCVNSIIIHCAGKVGEILASTSVAKYAKIHFPMTKVIWISSKCYKKIVELCPYIDEMRFFDEKYKYENFDDMLTCCRTYANTIAKTNKGSWVLNNNLHINTYFNYIFDQQTLKVRTNPFNEQMFDSVGDPYDVAYQPDIVYYPEFELKAKEIEKQFKKFIIIFPNGHGITPISIKNNLPDIAKVLAKKDIKVIVSGVHADEKYNIDGCIDYFGLELGTLLSLFRRAKCVVGVNSGIIFSSLFLRCPNIIMEDLRESPMWDIKNIKVDYKPNILSMKT
ncbi:MAG TPA: hypothetical protein VGB37_17315, partial [Candidatus Lokiarchaeia archaeon]